MKSKFEIEIEEFTEAFQDHKNQKIVLYGTGRMTATLVNGLNGFRIIGVCDRYDERVGDTIFGLPILSQEQAEEKGDLLIINTAPTYWNAIFSRICSWNIPIYFRNGERAIKKDENVDEANPYWRASLSDLRKEMESCDIITFDVFNTLVQRVCLNESDVFDIVQKSFYEEKQINHFVEERKIASAQVGDGASINEIYQMIAIRKSIPEKECKFLESYEYEIDRKLICPREEMVNLCLELLKTKTVYFITDMYYSPQQICEILEQVGIKTDLDKIWVSSKMRMSKSSGQLWKAFVSANQGKKIFHIGDDIEADIKAASRYDVHSYYVMNPQRMLEQSSLGKISGGVMSVYSSVMMGVINSKLFNDPFRLGKTKGHIAFRDHEEMGYCLLGPIAFAFIEWLIRNVKNKQIDNLVIFAREGYLLTEEYNYMRQLSGANIPEAKYLLISRRAIMNAFVKNTEDILEVASFPYVGLLSDFLEDRFNLKLSVEQDIDMSSVKDQKTMMRILEPYVDRILQEAQRQRENYLNYLNAIDIKGNLGVVDSFLYGNTQYYLGKFLERRMQGFYFLLDQSPDNKCLEKQSMCACFQDKGDLSGKNNEIWKYALFLEAFYTAPHGMVKEIDCQGKALYDERKENQKNFEIREEMQRGILRFFEDFYPLFTQFGLQVDISFTKQLFGCFMDGGFVLTEEMKKSFCYDNAILNRKEVPIFE